MYFSFFKPPDCRKRSVVRGRGFIQRFPMLSGGSADRTGHPLAVLPLTAVAYPLRVNIPLSPQVWNFCSLPQIGTQRSGSDLERRSNAIYELCRLRRREGYAVCFDERAVEAQPLPAKALLLLVLVGYGKPCSSFCCRASMILEI